MNKPIGTLFLVEDNLDDERLSLRAISGSGIRCEVEVARDGVQALARLIGSAGLAPDLIVLDFHLPGLSGLEILRALRKEERTRRIPIVILSDLGSVEQSLACLDEGASSYVQKPSDPQTYIERVGLMVQYWLTVDRRPNGA